ncbi:MAG: TIGR02391 family protein [Acidobacteriota bacterium]|nr:TIGR02391 family protein [Acidobacteriota bacterium]
MQITKALPTVESVLQLEAEELAPYLLEHLAGNPSHLNLTNFLESSVGDTVMAHYGKDVRVDEAFREAWSWLEREGLLVAKSHRYFISRRGLRVRGRQDFEAFRRSNVLPKASLHPVVAERVWSSFVRGEYDIAVLQAFKEVEIAVRAAGGFPAVKVGVALMGEAFKANVGPLTDKSLPEAEQLAMLSLFSGAMGLFKNPTSHRHIGLTNGSEAAEMVALASLLMRIVDARSNSAAPATA